MDKTTFFTISAKQVPVSFIQNRRAAKAVCRKSLLLTENQIKDVVIIVIHQITGDGHGTGGEAQGHVGLWSHFIGSEL